MRDGGAIILFVFGLVASLQFISRYIIDPYIKRKNGEKILVFLRFFGDLWTSELNKLLFRGL